MFAYSARKNSANAMPEYSTWKPATISDSPSATSNGARLVSATPEMKYTTNSGNSQNQFQASDAARLAAHDVAEIQAAGRHQHADQREAHRDFVGDDLRGRAHRAEERVLRVRRPAGEDDAVHAHRSEREHVQQPRVDVRDHQLRRQRNHRPGGERRNQRDHRRERNRNLFAFAGMMTSLISSLMTSANGWPRPGNRPKMRDAVRAAPQLHPADDLALPQRQSARRR